MQATHGKWASVLSEIIDKGDNYSLKHSLPHRTKSPKKVNCCSKRKKDILRVSCDTGNVRSDTDSVYGDSGFLLRSSAFVLSSAQSAKRP